MFSAATVQINKTEKYGNFHTIDWMRDITKDRFRNSWLQKETKKGLFEKFQFLFDATSGWFAILLMGISAG